MAETQPRPFWAYERESVHPQDESAPQDEEALKHREEMREEVSAIGGRRMREVFTGLLQERMAKHLELGVGRSLCGKGILDRNEKRIWSLGKVQQGLREIRWAFFDEDYTDRHPDLKLVGEPGKKEDPPLDFKSTMERLKNRVRDLVVTLNGNEGETRKGSLGNDESQTDFYSEKEVTMLIGDEEIQEELVSASLAPYDPFRSSTMIDGDLSVDL
uniref:Uncharacterized protein n=1 Tax=Chromera velia CCMP2878 TaxID=1169474 RepID=A0A0G4HHI8_9ALVE|eukprot:Cvel_6895.t1-p1 / transcript=Cvel_6895.t1 / gene=Cvel_6895 / organism=Chromera_velia_CCMP2878 / gene_product=hypothetical protein / transcript_product=hypothetical protein / location=Cvel_scaffold348:82984-91402(+) / protein_length=214 / sequence_SO=supercontig / SO=protein_coding / is_pseudo=false